MFDAHNHIHSLSPAENTDCPFDCCSAALFPTDWAGLEQFKKMQNGVHLVVPAFGTHPWHALQGCEGLEEFLFRHPEACIGETGLCGLKKEIPHEIQKSVFRRQLELAVQLNRPVIVHGARAWAPVLKELRRCPPPAFLLHAFSASAEVFRDALKLGAFFSVSGTVLNEASVKVREICRLIPDNRLLLETDAPDLAAPGDLPLILQTAARLRGTDSDQLDVQTTLLAKEFFRCH